MSSKTPPTPTTPSTNFTGETLVNHPPTSAAAKPTDHSLQYRRKLTHLTTALAPLLSITSGTAHPSFPSTILHYHLLTEDQLNELAHHYHQRTPSRFSLCYPLPVVGRWHQGTTEPGEAAKLEDKRRRFGRFVGLRGCESPVDGDGGEADREREQRAMELYVEGEIKRREEKAWAEMTGRGKGCW
ncbi:MAG: hypothetical protein Q9208_005380 [Pyrenodesmia sp. 3 TL-2023]